MHMQAAGNIARGSDNKGGVKVMTTMKDFLILSKIGMCNKA